MQFLDPNKMIMKALVVNQGVKGTDMILTSDSAGLVSWKPTSAYTNNKDYDHYIGELFGGGVVVAVWRDGNVEKCLVAAVQDVASVITYQQSGSTTYGINYRYPWTNVLGVRSGATHSSYGATNSAIILAQPGFSNVMDPLVNYVNGTITGFSGAAKWTDVYVNTDIGYGAFNDWYLPSIFELSALGSNIMIVNKVLYQLSIDKGISLTDVSNLNVKSGNIPSLVTLVSGMYWSSTEKNGTSAYFMDARGDGQLSSFPKDMFSGVYEWDSGKLRVRPFRIATDNQVSFKFDAEWIILTYRYFDGKDLETLTRMISPTFSTVPSITPWNERTTYNYGVNGGPFASNYVGYWAQKFWGSKNDFTPGSTYSTTPSAGYYSPAGTGNNLLGTYSILWWAGDNQGFGSDPQAYETVIVNIGAFKFHYPGQKIIRVDCRGQWFGTTGTQPVRLGVDMYKGGQPIKNGPVYNNYVIWENPTATSKLNLDSLDAVVTSRTSQQTGKTPEGLYDSDRIAVFEYNLDTKIGKIIAG